MWQEDINKIRKELKKRKPKFIRQQWSSFLRLGKRSKKKRVWRRAKGNQSKVRLKIKGHAKKVDIGYRMPKKLRNFVKGLKPIFVEKIEDLKKVGKDCIGVVPKKFGTRKRLEIAKEANELGIKLNFDTKKFIEKFGNGKKTEEKK